MLEHLETRIEGYRTARTEAAAALLEIKTLFDQQDSEVEQWPDFLSYCLDRWDFQKSHAYALLDLGKYLLAAPDAPIPNEYQLRKLKKVNVTSIDPDPDPWKKRAKAFSEVATEVGDVNPDELEGELIQRKWIAPRSVKNQLSREEQQEKARLEALRPFDNRAKFITMEIPAHRKYTESDWFQPLKDWIKECEGR